MDFFCKCSLWVCFIIVTSWPVSLRLTTLPKTIHEAEIMLREGSLDPQDWELLRNFYVQPVNVPLGELAYMTDLFDIHLDDLPVSQEQLKPYEPWTKKDIARFYADFPALEKYRPILSFSKTRDRRPFNASIALTSDDTWKTTVLSRFSVNPMSGVSASGSFGHSDSDILWKRRNASVLVPSILSLQAGNFSAPFYNGLFYGFFPGDNSAQPLMVNWLEGQARSWNGLFVQSEQWRRVQVSLLYHERSTEKVAGVFCDVMPHGGMHVSAGVSRLTIDEAESIADSGEYYFHCGISGTVAGFGYRVNTGTGQRHPLAVPLSAEISRKVAKGDLTMLFSRVPASAGLARSRTAYECKNDLDQDDSTPRDITLAECRTAFHFSDGFRTAFAISYITSGISDAVTSAASASGTGVFDYRVSYSYHMSTAASRETHAATVSLERGIAQWLSTGITGNFYMASAGYQSVLITLPVDFFLPRGLALRPYASLFAGSNGNKSGSAGLRQSMDLFDRTRCEADIETSFNEHKKQTWDFNARAYFSF
jgi:hypothetical protein